MKRLSLILTVACLASCDGSSSSPAAMAALNTPQTDLADIYKSTDVASGVATVSSSGMFVLTPPNQSGQTWTSQVAFGPDDADSVQSYAGQAGSQVHFRLTRSTPEIFGNPSARDFLISPYSYGTVIEYPSTVEVWSRNLSVHNNHQGCTSQDTTEYLADPSCFAAGHLWVGDGDDYGGWFMTAYDVRDSSGTLDRSKSFSMIAADTFSHTSHGDMLMIVRDPLDSFRFQAGVLGGADGAETYKSYTVARIDATGKGYFNGGTQVGGADFAESIRSSSSDQGYEAGDVLAVDPQADRQITRAHGRYSTLVAGIYSTKPGVLGSRHISETAVADEVPMAIVGIVPCNVVAENGPISRGDLLVTSSTPGYAMRGTDHAKLAGAVVGKALGTLSAGKGKIEVLVMLR